MSPFRQPVIIWVSGTEGFQVDRRQGHVERGVHNEEMRFSVMWPMFLPIVVPVAVNWHVVVNYHVYGQEQPPVRMDRVIESEKKCVGFVDTTTARTK